MPSADRVGILRIVIFAAVMGKRRGKARPLGDCSHQRRAMDEPDIPFHPRVMTTTWTQHVVVQEVPECGRGVVATRDLPPGTTIMVTEPWAKGDTMSTLILNGTQGFRVCRAGDPEGSTVADPHSAATPELPFKATLGSHDQALPREPSHSSPDAAAHVSHESCPSRENARTQLDPDQQPQLHPQSQLRPQLATQLASNEQHPELQTPAADASWDYFQQHVLNLAGGSEEGSIPEGLMQELTARLVCVTESEVARLVSVIRHNAFRDDGASYLFTDSCMLNHSCYPSCSWNINPATGKMEVWNVLPVKKGAELTISYLGDDVSQPNAARLAMIQRNWGFECRCKKCTAGF